MVSDRSLRKQWKLLEPIGVARCFIGCNWFGFEDGSLWGQKVGSWCCFVCFWRVWRLFHLEFFCFLEHRWVVDLEMVQNWSRSFFWGQKKMMNEDLSLSRWGSVVVLGVDLQALRNIVYHMDWNDQPVQRLLSFKYIDSEYGHSGNC